MSPGSDSPKVTQSCNAYELIVNAYLFSLFKLHSSRACHLSLEIALLKFRSGSWQGTPLPDGLEEIKGISFVEFDSFRYVTRFAHLVLATTLLDTFLTDTTRFMFLLFPESIGKSQGVTVGDIVKATSTAELLRTAVDKRAREVSYKSFTDRIQYLESQYGLLLTLDDEIRQSVETFAGVRNAMIHDQAYYELTLADDLSVSAVVHSCPIRPKPIETSDIVGATAAYFEVVRAVASSVFRDVLKTDIPKGLTEIPPWVRPTEGDVLPSA